jgi:hypothetical protein
MADGGQIGGIEVSIDAGGRFGFAAKGERRDILDKAPQVADEGSLAAAS